MLHWQEPVFGIKTWGPAIHDKYTNSHVVIVHNYKMKLEGTLFPALEGALEASDAHVGSMAVFLTVAVAASAPLCKIVLNLLVTLSAEGLTGKKLRACRRLLPMPTSFTRPAFKKSDFRTGQKTMKRRGANTSSMQTS